MKLLGYALVLVAAILIGYAARAQERPTRTVAGMVGGVGGEVAGNAPWGVRFHDELGPGPSRIETVPAPAVLHLSVGPGAGRALAALAVLNHGPGAVTVNAEIGGTGPLAAMLPGFGSGGAFMAKWPGNNVQLNSDNDTLTLTGSGTCEIVSMFR